MSKLRIHGGLAMSCPLRRYCKIDILLFALPANVMLDLCFRVQGAHRNVGADVRRVIECKCTWLQVSAWAKEHRLRVMASWHHNYKWVGRDGEELWLRIEAADPSRNRQLRFQLDSGREHPSSSENGREIDGDNRVEGVKIEVHQLECSLQAAMRAVLFRFLFLGIDLCCSLRQPITDLIHHLYPDVHCVVFLLADDLYLRIRRAVPSSRCGICFGT
eukprot:gene22982-biopygen8354